MAKRVIGLDAFYHQIKRTILMVKGYTEIKHSDKLIKMCRLKPYEMVFFKEKGLQLRRWWIDEYGNSFHITKDKKFQIILNDLEIDRNKIVSTDLYGKLSINKTWAMSKMAFILIGNETGASWDHFVLALLGIDDYLRVFTLLDDQWMRISPLLLGLNCLKSIGTNTEIKNFKELKRQEVIIRPCQKQRAWLSCLPLEDELKRELPDNLLAYVSGEK